MDLIKFKAVATGVVILLGASLWPVEVAQAHEPANRFAQNKSANCKAPRLRQGMKYNHARKVVLDFGFQAPQLPAYGYSREHSKVVSECFGSVDLCNKFPEIESCSGQGYCRMSFKDVYGNELVIITYGPLEDTNVISFQIECR